METVRIMVTFTALLAGCARGQRAPELQVVGGNVVDESFNVVGELRPGEDLQQFIRRQQPNAPPEPLGLAAGATEVLGNIATGFSCEGLPYGYYADPDNDCQVYHVCSPINGGAFAGGVTLQYSFFCNRGTEFDQALLTCIHSPDPPSAKCSDARSLYAISNSQFGTDVNFNEQGGPSLLDIRNGEDEEVIRIGVSGGVPVSLLSSRPSAGSESSRDRPAPVEVLEAGSPAFALTPAVTPVPVNSPAGIPASQTVVGPKQDTAPETIISVGVSGGVPVSALSGGSSQLSLAAGPEPSAPVAGPPTNSIDEDLIIIPPQISSSTTVEGSAQPSTTVVSAGEVSGSSDETADDVPEKGAPTADGLAAALLALAGPVSGGRPAFVPDDVIPGDEQVTDLSSLLLQPLTQDAAIPAGLLALASPDTAAGPGSSPQSTDGAGLIDVRLLNARAQSRPKERALRKSGPGRASLA